MSKKELTDAQKAVLERGRKKRAKNLLKKKKTKEKGEKKR